MGGETGQQGSDLSNPGRMTARSFLEAIIQVQKRELVGLEALLRTIKWEEISDDEESALWGILSRLGKSL